VDIKDSRNDVMASCVYDLSALVRLEADAKSRNFFATNPDIANEGARWSNDIPALYERIEFEGPF
jgi:hypothetical protein